MTLAAVAAAAGVACAADPVDRACLFPRGWQYRLDPDDRGRRDEWFRADRLGPWDDLPDDPKRRVPAIRAWTGVVWLRTTVTLPTTWRGKRIFVGFSRARWPDDVQVWFDGAALPAVRNVPGPAAGSPPVAFVTAVTQERPNPLGQRGLTSLPPGRAHRLVIRTVSRGGDPFDPPAISAGSSLILAQREGDIAGWFEGEPFRRAWLVRRFPGWVWPLAMLGDDLWLIHGNAPSPAHTGVIGDRHEPALTHFGGVILCDGDDRQIPRPLAVIVPWIYDHTANRLFACEEANSARWRLRKGSAPIPEITWQAGPVRVHETLSADRFGRRGEWAVAMLRVVMVNTTQRPADMSLYVAAHQRMDRPGAAPLRTVACEATAGTIRANGRLLVVSDAAAADGGGVGFTDGAVSDVSAYARLGLLPAARTARDARGMASAALRYPLSLKPGESREVTLRIPYEYFFPMTRYVRHPPALSTLARRDIADPVGPEERLARIDRRWRAAVPVRLDIPDTAARDLFYASACNLLLGLDGDVPYAGATFYSTQVFHDAGDILVALAMLGVRDEVDRAVTNLARRQDRDGLFAGWAEDAARRQGRIGWGIARACRLRRDLRLTQAVWPSIARAADLAAASAARSRGPELAHTPRFGLVDRGVVGFDQSVRYTGNWLCAAFLAEAGAMARTVSRPAAARRLNDAAARLQADLTASLRRVVAVRGGRDLPLGTDGEARPIWSRCPFDGALAHAPALIACRPAGVAVPETLLRRAYEHAFRSGTTGGGWRCAADRFVGGGAGPGTAMLMLGMRREAHQTLTFLVESQTGPGALSEWNVRTDRAHRLYDRWCRGTGPTHLWSAALVVMQVRTMFLYEEGNRRLALLAGVPSEWLTDGRTVALENAPTHFGLVSIRCTSRLADGRLELDILPEADPPEGYTLFLPFERRAARILVAGMGPQPGGRLDEGVRLPVGSRRVIVVLEP